MLSWMCNSICETAKSLCSSVLLIIIDVYVYFVFISEPQSVATETTQAPKIIQTPDVNKETKVTGKEKTEFFITFKNTIFTYLLCCYVKYRLAT